MNIGEVRFWKENKECRYKEAKLLKITCSFCNEDIFVKLNQRNLECLKCNQNIKFYGIIYKATRKTNGRIYIGQTITPLRERIRGHLQERKNRTYFGLALKKYGVDEFDWEIIDFVSLEDKGTEQKYENSLNEKEIKWIKHYNTFVGWKNSNGYNLTTGGGNFLLAEISIAKRSAEKHGLAKLTNEQVKIIKLLLRDTGMYLKEISTVMDVSITTIYDIKHANSWGKVPIDENDLLSGQYQEFINLYPIGRNTFFVYDVHDLSFIGEFGNQRVCAELLGVDYRNLNVVLKGRRKTTGNYTFIYKSNYSEEWLKNTLPTLKSNIGKIFYVYNYKTGSFVDKYFNQNHCADKLGLSHIAINECLWKKQAFHKDYIFIFEEDHNEEWVKELIKKAKKNKMLSRK
ncbi:GIY-YIG nuclease family protein [Priestia megaterium]